MSPRPRQQSRRRGSPNLSAMTNEEREKAEKRRKQNAIRWKRWHDRHKEEYNAKRRQSAAKKAQQLKAENLAGRLSRSSSGMSQEKRSQEKLVPAVQNVVYSTPSVPAQMISRSTAYYQPHQVVPSRAAVGYPASPSNFFPMMSPMIQFQPQQHYGGGFGQTLFRPQQPMLPMMMHNRMSQPMWSTS